jgi:hypothetical protein
MSDHESTVTPATPEGLSLGLQRIGVPEPLADVIAEDIGLSAHFHTGGAWAPNLWKQGHAIEALGRYSITTSVWIDGVLTNVIVSPLGDGLLRVTRGISVETTPTLLAPPLDELVRWETGRVAFNRNSRDEAHARLLMANLYAGAIEHVTRKGEGERNESTHEIAQVLLRRLVHDLRSSAKCFQPEPRKPGAFTWPEDALEDGLPAWDAALARFLEKNGKPEFAENVRENGLKRTTDLRLWSLWNEDEKGSPPVVRLLADAFENEINAETEKFSAKRPALVHPVMVEVTELHSHAWKRQERDGQLALQLPTAGNVTVASIGDETLGALFAKGLEWLSSIAGHRLLRWEVVEGHRRYLTTGGDRVLRVEGGWAGLAEKIGASTKKDADKLRGIVLAQAHCRFEFPDGSAGNLLSYREPTDPAARGRTRVVEITLGTPLLPHYVSLLPQGKSAPMREARRLVPMLADLPPFVGRSNDHGAQASLALAVVTELRVQAARLVEDGGAQVPFDTLARRFRIGPDLLARVLDRWTKDGDDGPAFLQRVDATRVTLGDAHAPERDFILDAGKRELDGRAVAQAATEKRQGSRERLARKARR